MSSITIIEHDGTEHTLAIEEGVSLMELATNNDIPGIDADCGGACACGTCHIIVDDAWSEKVGGPAVEENQMLDLTPERAATSRLSCQLQVTAAMD
ncbi:2Fe-2S ferredoxin, partial [Oleiphilus sp. HI0122]